MGREIEQRVAKAGDGRRDERDEDWETYGDGG